MSERQAKLKRKNQEKNEVVIAKKSKGDIILNIIIAIVIIAVFGLGTWGIASKYKDVNSAAPVTNVDTNTYTDAQATDAEQTQLTEESPSEE